MGFMSEPSDSQGQRPIALVTGGNQGIGESIARALANAGAVVFVAGRSAARNAAVAASIETDGGIAHGLELDVCDPASIASAFDRAELQAKAPIMWLVNNAGIALSAPLVRTEDDAFLRQMDVNFHGARRCTARALPAMLEAGGGRVVNVASSAGLQGYGYVAAYCASKHALVGYTRAAQVECGSKGVTFAAVCPHYVDTPMLEASVEAVMQKTGRTREEVRAFFASENPGGKLVTPAEVAAAVVELCTGPGGDVWELDGSGPAKRIP